MILLVVSCTVLSVIRTRLQRITSGPKWHTTRLQLTGSISISRRIFPLMETSFWYWPTYSPISASVFNSSTTKTLIGIISSYKLHFWMSEVQYIQSNFPRIKIIFELNINFTHFKIQLVARNNNDHSVRNRTADSSL